MELTEILHKTMMSLATAEATRLCPNGCKGDGEWECDECGQRRSILFLRLMAAAHEINGDGCIVERAA
jgi:hypothetical protein